MKFFHLSDLHLGKRLNGFSLMEDQEYILREILKLAAQEKPQAVILAGDIYDKVVPSTEAVAVFDRFLTELAKITEAVFLISGNHDSPERLAFGGRLMAAEGVYTAPVYDGKIESVTLQDEFGDVTFRLLPFLKPANVRRFYPDENIVSYTDALTIALRDTPREGRQVLVTHQFVTGAVKGDSEEITVGGADNVDASVFDGFSYVALGHIHGAQNVGCPRLRYCGTPLKYSFSEAQQEKSITVVDMDGNGDCIISTLPLKPLREMRVLRGKYEEVTLKTAYTEENRKDFLHIILTDEEDIPNALGRLRVIYPNIMRLTYDNTRTKNTAVPDAPESTAADPLTLFSQLYEKQNNLPLSDTQREYLERILEEIMEGSL